MPRSAKRSGVKSGRSLSLDATKSDFTLYDFAHCSPIRLPAATSGRLKKGEVNAFHTQAKQTCRQSMLSDDSLLWYERDLSDFDRSDEETSVAFLDQLNEIDENKNFDNKLGGHRTTNNHFGNGVTYPLDIWFLIGKYIRPEDVAVFSSVCRSSHLVVHSARFWLNLYDRFYTSDIDLPSSLLPSAAKRVHGLKSRVVRALFYVYPPFQNRLRHAAPFENDPDCFEGMSCIRTWHQQIKQMWHFYFKFEHRSDPSSCPVFPARVTKRLSTNSFRGDDNVMHNPEDRCSVLQVVSTSFILLPQVVGLVLIKASVSVGHDMRTHKLKLIFNPTMVRQSKSAFTSGTTVNMDPVTNIHVIRWWDPKYPCRF